jgi:hypothetical protein
VNTPILVANIRLGRKWVVVTKSITAVKDIGKAAEFKFLFNGYL